MIRVGSCVSVTPDGKHLIECNSSSNYLGIVTGINENPGDDNIYTVRVGSGEFKFQLAKGDEKPVEIKRKLSKTRFQVLEIS